MNSRTYTNRRYLDALTQRILIFDGAMGTSLQMQNLTARDFGGERTVGCNDYLVITCPQAVEKVHRSFLEVGVDVLETDTFRANRITLGEYGLGDRVFEINRAAAQLSRRLADEYSTPEKPRFVAGSIGPSGKLPSMNDPELSNIDFDGLEKIFCEQATGLLQGGVDLIIIETSQDILEVKATIAGVQRAFAETGIYLPIQTQITLDTTGRMLLGTDISAVLAILEGQPIDVLGMNCSTGPDYMREPIQFLGENSSLPVSCIPNAGLPLNVDGQAIYPLTPEPFSDALLEFVEKFHVSVVGGCCGTTPAHLKRLVEKIGVRKPAPRPAIDGPRLASAASAQPMLQAPPPFFIGERLNTQGSKKFKELILAEDYDACLDIARQQVRNGAHGLDLCTALTERPDEAAIMRRLIKTLAPTVRAPLVIDSTEVEVIETALKTAPGRCLINSTHLEGGRAKADRIFDLAKKYNAAVIVLTIDEAGMAKTADRKLEIARRLYDIAVNEHGLRPEDLVYDALTFTLATGQAEFTRSALETLEGIRQIKKHLPGVLTSLGVSNVSFGLAPAARGLINSVMLYHAVQAGLDMAIVNPAQITPFADIPANERSLAEDLIFARTPTALQNLVEYFEKTGGVDRRKVDARAEAIKAMTSEERLHWRIVHRHPDEIETDIDAILQNIPAAERSDTAVRVLNSVLLPAMKEVGDKFGAGELILPFVLQSAEVMKKAVSHLETYLEKKEGTSKGLVVLATVYGDVHDIGKNLVKTILSNNGYQVVDLGKQAPAETIISKAVELKADAIGLSALLVSTSKQMPLIVNELQRRGQEIPVLVGGAAINPRFGQRILQTEGNGFYGPGVFYCKDAFEGLATMDALHDPSTRAVLLEKTRKAAEVELERPARGVDTARVVHSAIKPVEAPPKPLHWGARVVRQMPLDPLFQLIVKKELFRLSWGAKNKKGEEWETLKAEFEARLEVMRREALKDGWLKPQGVYGYFPCQSDGNSLVVYDPASVEAGSPREIERFTFPRQPANEYLCLADYFNPVSSGVMDTVEFQVVTVGKAATDRVDRLQNANDYSEAYYTHGLAVQMAEATAEYLHQYVRRELGIPPEQGKRYSWGYPNAPELSDHARVFNLLPVEAELGMSLTSAYQLIPEQSTAAFIIHHPEAKYFNLG